MSVYNYCPSDGEFEMNRTSIYRFEGGDTSFVLQTL